MATYKLVNADQLDSDLTAVGNAIRSKGGTSAGLSFPAGMVSAIGAISTGVELNFDVVPGLTRPETAAENTIWVETEKIGAWYFSPLQPEGMQEWDVWFIVSTSSSIEFNALKKNGIQVYPVSAKQYVSGKLNNVAAMSYQGGEWVNWIPEGYIYAAGNECEHITGGWRASGNVTKNSSNMHVLAEDSKSASVETANYIDLTNYDYVHINILVSDGSKGPHESRMFLNVINKSGATVASTSLHTTGVRSIPVGSLSSGHKIQVYLYSSAAGYSYYVTFDNVWLE